MLFVIDNSPTFISNEIKISLKSNGIQHKPIAPYHSSMNDGKECIIIKKGSSTVDDPVKLNIVFHITIPENNKSDNRNMTEHGHR